MYLLIVPPDRRRSRGGADSCALHTERFIFLSRARCSSSSLCICVGACSCPACLRSLRYCLSVCLVSGLDVCLLVSLSLIINALRRQTVLWETVTTDTSILALSVRLT